MNRSLDILEKRILKQESPELTPSELEKLFNLPASPLFNFCLYKCLMEKAINQDSALLAAVTKSANKDDLVPIALCLRTGSNPNLYVRHKGQSVHILAYIHTLFNEKTEMSHFLLTVVIMLVLRGSNPGLPMYSSGNDQPITAGWSVKTWLNDNGYQNVFDTISKEDDVLNEAKPEVKKKLAILMNQPEYYDGEYVKEDILSAIDSFADKIYPIVPYYGIKNGLDYMALQQAVKDYNFNAYVYLIDKGQEPSYVIVNQLLYGITKYKHHPVMIDLFKSMILKALSIGFQMDQAQRNMIETISPAVTTEVQHVYAVPYWKKTCSYMGSQVVPDSLAQLAFSLGIDPTADKKTVCKNLEDLASVNPDMIKGGAIAKNRLSAASKLYGPSEFIGGEIPSISFRNKAIDGMEVDLLDYNQEDVVYYRDAQGACWAFSSDKFPALIERKRNMYTDTPLPASLIEEMKQKLAALRNLKFRPGGINTYTPVPISASIDKLREKDTIENKQSNDAINQFIARSADFGVTPEVINALTKEQMEKGLKNLGVTISFADYSTDHARITTARIVTSTENPKRFYDTIVMSQDTQY